MKKHHDTGAPEAQIRAEARKRLKAKKGPPAPRPSDDTQKLIHELRVHEIELEMQNEELKRGRIEIEKSRLKYSDLFDFAPIGYMLLDPKGLIKEINLTGATMLGVERSRLVNKPCSLFVSPGDTKAFTSHLRQCRETREKTITELRLKVNRSSTIVSRVMSAPYHESDEQGVLLKTVFTDITAIKEAQEELEDLNKELEGFNVVLAHDLSTPLRIIHGFSDMLVKYYSSKIDDEGKEFIDTIRANTRKMGQLIQELLNLSRLRRKDIKKTVIDMTALAAAIIDEVKPIEPGREIEFNLKPLPPASGEKALIRQVLLNLLQNSVKYTRPRKKAVVEIGGHNEKDENTYYVKDNGAGFDNAHAGRLFNLFRRLHPESAFEGTGAGLAIVKRIIERHGGRVWAEGKVDHGATFFFTLPVDTKDA